MGHSTVGRRPHYTARPSLELLEDRTVPSVAGAATVSIFPVKDFAPTEEVASVEPEIEITDEFIEEYTEEYSEEYSEEYAEEYSEEYFEEYAEEEYLPDDQVYLRDRVYKGEDGGEEFVSDELIFTCVFPAEDVLYFGDEEVTSEEGVPPEWMYCTMVGLGTDEEIFTMTGEEQPGEAVELVDPYLVDPYLEDGGVIPVEWTYRGENESIEVTILSVTSTPAEASPVPQAATVEAPAAPAAADDTGAAIALSDDGAASADTETGTAVATAGSGTTAPEQAAQTAASDEETSAIESSAPQDEDAPLVETAEEAYGLEATLPLVV